MLKVCVSGATGWTGEAIASAVAAATDMALVSCVARSTAGQEVLGAPCFASVDAEIELGQRRVDRLACLRLVIGRNAVFKIENNAIDVELRRLFEAPDLVARRQQHGAAQTVLPDGRLCL